MPQTVPSFAEQLATCHQSAVHLEMRDAYDVASETDGFADWQSDSYLLDEWREQRRGFLDLVRDAVGRGVVMRRARVVSEPVSDYIRFEHAGTVLNVEAGELVRWLPRRRTSDLALPGNDYWLFDGRTVRFNHFTGDGASGGPEVKEEPSVVTMCASAFEAVWERAVPHAEYQL